MLFFYVLDTVFFVFFGILMLCIAALERKVCYSSKNRTQIKSMGIWFLQAHPGEWLLFYVLGRFFKNFFILAKEGVNF